MVDDLNPPALTQLPPGFVITKKGGRPRKEARDAAIFLANYWRMNVKGDTAAQAARWIIEHWEGLGREASKGISDPAHIRACIRRANQRGLGRSLILQVGDGKPMIAMEVDPTDNNGNIQPLSEIGAGWANKAPATGARTWFWVPSMEIAAEGRTKDLQVTVEQELHHPSPIALAVSALIT